MSLSEGRWGFLFSLQNENTNSVTLYSERIYVSEFLSWNLGFCRL